MVCSGYTRPGQTGWELLNSFSLDVLLDVAYGEITQGASDEERAELDRKLEEVHEQMAGIPEDQVVEVRRKSSGEVIQISQARLAQLRRNAGGKLYRPKPGTEA